MDGLTFVSRLLKVPLDPFVAYPDPVFARTQTITIASAQRLRITRRERESRRNSRSVTREVVSGNTATEEQGMGRMSWQYPPPVLRMQG